MQFTIHADHWKAALRSASRALSKHPAPKLRGVNVHFDPDNRIITFTGTDGYIIVTTDVPMGDVQGANGAVERFIPEDAVPLALDKDLKGELRIVVGSDKLAISTGSAETVVKAVESDFPDLSRFYDLSRRKRPEDEPVMWNMEVMTKLLNAARSAGVRYLVTPPPEKGRPLIIVGDQITKHKVRFKAVIMMMRCSLDFGFIQEKVGA